MKWATKLTNTRLAIFFNTLPERLNENSILFFY